MQVIKANSTSPLQQKRLKSQQREQSTTYTSIFLKSSYGTSVYLYISLDKGCKVNKKNIIKYLKKKGGKRKKKTRTNWKTRSMGCFFSPNLVGGVPPKESWESEGDGSAQPLLANSWLPGGLSGVGVHDELSGVANYQPVIKVLVVVSL